MEDAQENPSRFGEIVWVRRGLQRFKPVVNMYVKMELVEKIREVLHHYGGEDTIQMFRSGSLGHFLDFTGGNIARKAMHALICQEVKVQDPARKGRECLIHVSGMTLHFGPSEFALMSGLRFGLSSFGPNAAHVIPPRGIYHQLFDGKKTTVLQMYEKFTNKRLANHPPDYVKVANILIVYRMLICMDPKQAIHEWVWALVEDVETWNSFPWGSYAFQILMHFVCILPRRRSDMTRQDDGAYHWYGPVWAFQTWACEVFPDMVHRLGVSGCQMTTPRFLRWSFTAPSIDLSRSFDRQMDVQPMVPSAAERLTPYFQTVDGDCLLGVRFIPARGVSKKKLLSAMACGVVLRTCAGTSNVVTSAPRRRSARTVQLHRQHRI